MQLTRYKIVSINIETIFHHLKIMIFDELWFWILIIALVAIGFGVYMYEVSYKSKEGVPIWVYLFLALGGALLIIAFIVAIVKYHASKTEAFIEGHLEGQAENVVIVPPPRQPQLSIQPSMLPPQPFQQPPIIPRAAQPILFKQPSIRQPFQQPPMIPQVTQPFQQPPMIPQVTQPTLILPPSVLEIPKPYQRPSVVSQPQVLEIPNQSEAFWVPKLFQQPPSEPILSNPSLFRQPTVGMNIQPKKSILRQPTMGIKSESLPTIGATVGGKTQFQPTPTIRALPLVPPGYQQ